ncbi:MAG: M48 family metalloprotease [Sphingopyxis sp.]
MRHAVIIAAAIAVLSTPMAASASASDDLTALRKQEERVAAIGERLSISAATAGWCEGGHSLGWTLGEIGQYGKRYRAAARALWGVPTGATLFISALAPDGAAAQAGLRTGMGIVSIAGRTPMRNPYQSASNHARLNSEQLVERSLAAGSMVIETLNADGTHRQWQLTPRPSCATRFEVGAEDDEQAYADGEVVQVTAGMGRYTDDNDQELAAVIAHELAHNILRHIPRGEQSGTPENYTRYLGRYTNITRSMEEEADRMSVWLLSLAGYEPQTPIAFWRRFGPGHDSAHPLGRTHDRWQDRVAALESEIETMRAAKQRNSNARPTLLDRRDLVPVPGARAVIGDAPATNAPVANAPVANATAAPYQ